MDENKDGLKKAVTWYCGRTPDADKSEDENDAIIFRGHNNGRQNQMKCKSLEPNQETIPIKLEPSKSFMEQSSDIVYADRTIGWVKDAEVYRIYPREYIYGRLNTRLLEAAENGDTQKISKLLGLDANPNATCRLNHVSACHVAAMINNDSLSLLIKSGAETLRTDKLGRTPLHLAAWVGYPRQIAVLLGFPEELQKKVAIEMSAAVEDEIKKLSCVDRQLINMPCNIGCLPILPKAWNDSMEHNCRRIKENLPVFSPGWTALHSASARAQNNCIQVLLAAGADPCARDLIGRTPLDVVGADFYSGQKIDVLNFRESIRLLLAAGGQFYTSHVDGLSNVNSPLHTAVELESQKAIEELLNAGACTTRHNSKGLSAMHICVEKKLREQLQLLANHRNENQDPYLATVDIKDRLGQTVLHASVKAKWTDGVCVALGAGASIFMKANDGESPIHAAAAMGDKNILLEILTVAKYAIDFRNQKGQTPLFIAIIHNHVEVVKLLIENGASLSVTLPDQGNVLHVVARSGNVEILQYLLNYGGRTIASLINVWQVNTSSLYTPIIYAVIHNHPGCVELLLTKGAKLDCSVPFKNRQETVWTSALHIAAIKNHFEIARIIIESDSQTINTFNKAGLLPLHEACIHGNREIVTLLVHKGADLSREAEHAKTKLSPVQMIMNNFSKPTAYMEEVFDSYISSQGLNLQDRECKVTVNYDILVPNPLDGRQMRVVKALVDTGNRYNQRKLLQHPLIESFLYLKWKALLPFFYAIIVLYGLFVLSLNVYVVSVFYYEDKNHIKNSTNNTPVYDFEKHYPRKPVPHYLHSEVWMYMIYLTVSLIALQEIIFIKIKNKRYFLFLETWVKFGSIGLSMFLPSVVSWREAKALPDMTSPEWARLIATIALLLSWLELMFLLSRFPSWGYYALMFGKVATKVFKILLTFMFLIIGFALCFMIQFRAMPPFEGPWAAIVKTIVMMTSEYDYSEMIKSSRLIPGSIIILRLTFITFVILASIVLMNLLVGVAVNDVNNLEQIGKQKRLEKQVDFLASLEDIVCHRVMRRIMPRWFNATWSARRKVRNVIVLRPREASCTYNKILPAYIRESIFEKAELQKTQMDDELGSMAYHMKLDEIHDAIVKQDEKVEQPEWSLDITVLNETVEKIDKDVAALRNEIHLLKQLLTRRHSFF